MREKFFSMNIMFMLIKSWRWLQYECSVLDLDTYRFLIKENCLQKYDWIQCNTYFVSSKIVQIFNSAIMSTK